MPRSWKRTASQSSTSGRILTKLSGSAVLTHKEWLWRINGEMRHFEAVYRVRISSAYDIMQRDMLERQYLSEKHRKLASLAR